MAPKKKQSRALVPTKARALSAKEFLDLADVPPEIEWFANITNPQTRRAYKNDLKDFMTFARVSNPEVLCAITG
jgi:integrase/recombinase XerD